MSKIKNYLVAALGISFIAPGFAFNGSNNAAAQSSPTPQNVRVVNTSREPVPTVAQGTTNISGSVQIAPGSKIAIDPAGNTVQLGNTELNPVLVRDLDNARDPFQETLDFDFADGQISRTIGASVPAGKRLVIEYASAALGVPTGQRITRIELGVTVNSVFARHFLTAISQGTIAGGNDSFAASQQMRVYADGLFVNVQRNDSTGIAGGSVTLSGYLINAS